MERSFRFPPAPFFVLLLFSIGFSSKIGARPFRVNLIPNGKQVSCGNCHISSGGGGALNPFGLAVEARVTPDGREVFWGPALAILDSDGDGLTNGEELQDPTGSWAPGSPYPGNPNLVSNPGRIGGPGDMELQLDVTTRLRYDRDAEGGDYDASFFVHSWLRNVIKDRLDLKISGWRRWDLDSNDAFDRALDDSPLRFSEIFADIYDLGPIRRLRVGRQYLDVDSLRFDGATLTTDPDEALSLFLFGGRPVTYFESAKDDWVGGGGVVWKPSWRTRHQLDAYFLRERGEGFLASSWRWSQYWTGRWRSASKLRFLDGEVRDLNILLTKYFSRWGLGLDVNYYLQPRERGRGDEARARSLSSFGGLLGSRAANYRLSADLSKFWRDTLLVRLGGSIRRRTGKGGEDTFNSVESNSAHLSVTWFDPWIENLDLTLAAERIHNELDALWMVTGEVGYRPDPRWDLSLGATFSRFDLDPVDFATSLNGQDPVDLLITDIRSLVYFGEIRWRPSRHYDIRADVSWEDTDAINGNGFSVGLAVNYHLRKFIPRGSAQ